MVSARVWEMVCRWVCRLQTEEKAINQVRNNPDQLRIGSTATTENVLGFGDGLGDGLYAAFDRIEADGQTRGSANPIPKMQPRHTYSAWGKVSGMALEMVWAMALGSACTLQMK